MEYKLDPLMRQLSGFALLMTIERIKWTTLILNTQIDRLTELEQEIYFVKNELVVAARTLKGVQRKMTDY